MDTCFHITYVNTIRSPCTSSVRLYFSLKLYFNTQTHSKISLWMNFSPAFSVFMNETLFTTVPYMETLSTVCKILTNQILLRFPVAWLRLTQMWRQSRKHYTHLYSSCLLNLGHANNIYFMKVFHLKIYIFILLLQ